MEATIIDRLFRRVLLMIGRGRITLVDDSGAVQKLQVVLGALETKDNLPRLVEYGLTSSPPPGSDVVAAHIAGDRSNGVVLASGHQGSRPRGLAPGEAMLYQQNGIQLHLTNGGLVANCAGLPVVINNAAGVTINSTGEPIIMNTPLLKVSGDIIDNYAANEHNVRNMREIYNEHDHISEGPGSPTSVPQQPQ